MFGAKSHVNPLKMEVYIPLSIVSSAPVPHDSQKYEIDKYPITSCRGDLTTSIHIGFMYSFLKCNYLKYYLDSKTSVIWKLEKGAWNVPVDDGVSFVIVPAVDIGMQSATTRVTLWNKICYEFICLVFAISSKTEDQNFLLIKIVAYLDFNYFKI